MFIDFFHHLRAADIPVSLQEYLLLMRALDRDLADRSVDKFYVLARACLVKDERHIDRFDRAFAEVFRGITSLDDTPGQTVPDDWLKALAKRHLSDAERRELEALGGWEKIMEELQKRLAEQKSAHHGGNKWIGTGGTSPFGNNGYNPAGIRIGQHGPGNNRAIKVWDRRDYKDLDDDVELGTRNMKVALRKLRKFARQGTPDELDLEQTINRTAHHGYLDIHMRPERRNAVNVLMLFDVGGSMDWHIETAEQLFSAARSEFKSLEYYYFHNCIYERLWQDNSRRRTNMTSTLEVFHTYPASYKVIIVGDAYMSPYELTMPGGSVEHMNAEPGLIWLTRLTSIYKSVIWLNPMAQEAWPHSPSISLVKKAMHGRMYPLTIAGLEAGMRELLC